MYILAVDNVPVNVVAVTVAALAVPVTFKLPKVPTVVAHGP